MDNKHIKAKLDTYIKEYSKLLEENANLKLTLEKELLEREKMINEYKVIINHSTELTQRIIEDVEITTMQINKYKEEMLEIFEDFNNIIELVLNKENLSEKDIKDLKEKMDNLKESLNKPIER